MLAQQPLWVYQLPAVFFIFCFGAIVGSFINVVIFRLPAGMSIITPRSRCPTCGWQLTWRENLPVVGWMLLRGRCSRCETRISVQYPVIELLTAVLFVTIYVLFYVVRPGTPWWGQIGGPWWYFNGGTTAPAFLAIVFLLAGLIAMTVIDARTFTIPIQIPVALTLFAFVAWPVQVLLPAVARPSQPWPIPLASWPWFWGSVGAMLGILLSLMLLRAGRFRYSFHDYHEFVEEGEVLGDYPHARREMGVELLFLAPCLIGFAIGWLALGRAFAGPPPLLVQAVGSTLLGYLVGGGLIWATRILGTLAFGREAMGMGDVHLLAAVGAVLGWSDAVLIFFIAPFSGLVWAVVSMALTSLLRRKGRELPYGPHLALATLVIILCRPGVMRVVNALLPGVLGP